jgi:hypothetical protein
MDEVPYLLEGIAGFTNIAAPKKEDGAGAERGNRPMSDS